MLNPGPKEVAAQAVSKLGGPPDFLGGDVESEAALESARMKERAQAGPAPPSVSLAAKQDVLEQSNMAGDRDWGYAPAPPSVMPALAPGRLCGCSDQAGVSLARRPLREALNG